MLCSFEQGRRPSIVRLFVAAPVPKGIGLTQISNGLRDHAPGIRLVPPGSWHATLRFLGDVKDPKQVEEAVQQAAAGHNAMDCTLRGVGAFQGPKRARVVWARVEADGLRRLADDVVAATKDIGEPPKGDFVAHATLGRLPAAKDLSAWIDMQQDKVLASGTIDRVVVYRSMTTNKGPVYQERLSVPLRQ